jgi:hypothetical protein
MASFLGQLVEIPRIKIGKKQTLATLVCKEALLFAEFLRDERKKDSEIFIIIIRICIFHTQFIFLK